MFRMKNVLLAAGLALVYTGSALALDAGEIANLVKSGVQDTVIINMVQSQKLNRPLSTSDVLMLNANGASPTLLEYLTRPEAVSAAYVPPEISAPTVVTTAPSPTVTVVDPTPTIVTQPNVVVTSPPPVYYSPTYYYPYSSYSYPTYRYRSRPSVSFGFSFGGGKHYRPRHHGGYRHGRRP